MDDPKKNTPQSERQPQTVKMSDEDFERFYDEIYQEFGPEDRNRDEDLTKDLPIRNYSNGYGKAPSAQPGRSAASRGSTPVGSRNVSAGANRNTYADNNRYVPPVKKDNSIKYLTIAVCLECLGIVGVVLWWVLMIL